MPGLDARTGQSWERAVFGLASWGHTRSACRRQRLKAKADGFLFQGIFWSRKIKFGELKPTWHPGNFESTQILHSIRQSGKLVVFQVVFALIWIHIFDALFGSMWRVSIYCCLILIFSISLHGVMKPKHSCHYLNGSRKKTTYSISYGSK